MSNHEADTTATPEFSRVAELAETLLEDVEPQFYPLPEFAKDERSSLREKQVLGGPYEGVTLREITNYQRSNPEVNSVLRLTSWVTKNDRPAATDYGAWYDDPRWTIELTPQTDPDTLVAVADLLEGKADERDPRFDQYSQ